MTSKKASTPRSCLFGSTEGHPSHSPLSAEHIWPRWYSKLIKPAPLLNHHFNTKIRYEPIGANSLSIAPETKMKSGQTQNKRLRIVCKKCNETWMSEIENSCKPALTPLITGQDTTIDIEKKKLINSWLTLKTIIIDQDDIESSGIGESEHLSFRSTRSPSSNWSIWIGYYEGHAWSTRFRHHGTKIISVNDYFDCDSSKLLNIQITTMVSGHLFAHIVTSEYNGLEFAFPSLMNGLLYKIWPLDSEKINWPTNKIGDADANYISDYFISMITTSPKFVSAPPMS